MATGCSKVFTRERTVVGATLVPCPGHVCPGSGQNTPSRAAGGDPVPPHSGGAAVLTLKQCKQGHRVPGQTAWSP